jgi:hypothetical protein
MMQELTLEEDSSFQWNFERTNENLEQISKVLNFDADSKSKSWLSQLDKDGNGKNLYDRIRRVYQRWGFFFFHSIYEKK